jgi:DNA-directed RNA polymerase specialized sigma24 family protein
MTADVLEPPGSRLAPRFVPELERAFQARRWWPSGSSGKPPMFAPAWKAKTDREVIAGCLEGEAAAWEALIARYQGFLFSVARDFGLAQSDAEDVFQNVCLKLCLHLQELRDRDRLMAWLGAMTRQAEAAARLGMPLGSIGPRRARCLQRLRKNMEEQDR